MWPPSGRPEMVKLLANNANLTIRDREGHTALSWPSLSKTIWSRCPKAGALCTAKESLQEEVSHACPVKAGK
jgi:hypothetical protein